MHGGPGTARASLAGSARVMSGPESVGSMPAHVEYQNDLHQYWVLERFPTLEEAFGFIEAVAETMVLPMRRFSAWADPTRELKGSWSASRAKLEDALRSGYRGDTITYLSTYSYNYRGSNYNEGSMVTFSDNFYDRGGLPLRPILVECARRLEEGDDATAIADTWHAAARAHLDNPRRAGDPKVVRQKVIVWPPPEE